MGMYTELIFGASLVDLPKDLTEALNKVINDNDLIISESAENIIEEYNLWQVLRGSSYYFGAHRNTPTFVYDDIGKCYVLSTRANCKNYSNQIRKFIEYIRSYIKYGSGDNDIFAYVMYEENEFPIMYSKDKIYNIKETTQEEYFNN